MLLLAFGMVAPGWLGWENTKFFIPAAGCADSITRITIYGSDDTDIATSNSSMLENLGPVLLSHLCQALVLYLMVIGLDHWHSISFRGKDHAN